MMLSLHPATMPICSFRKRDTSPDGGSERVQIAATLEREAICRAGRGRWVQLRGLLKASRLLGLSEANSSSLKEKKSEAPVAKQPLISRSSSPFWQDLVGFVTIGLCSSTAIHWFVFYTHCKVKVCLFVTY